MSKDRAYIEPLYLLLFFCEVLCIKCLAYTGHHLTQRCSEYNPPYIQAPLNISPSKILMSLYKPRAYIWDFMVSPEK